VPRPDEARESDEWRAFLRAIPQVTAKFKYGGNVDEAHRLAVAERLAARDAPGDATVRDALLQRLEKQSERPPVAP
jgi:hypothetical protein